MMRREGHVGHLQQMRNVYKIKAGKSEGKRPLGRLQYDEKLMRAWTKFNWFRKGSNGSFF
jgi:hypothetical protein